jgi:hypothetical protein
MVDPILFRVLRHERGRQNKTSGTVRSAENDITSPLERQPRHLATSGLPQSPAAANLSGSQVSFVVLDVSFPERRAEVSLGTFTIFSVSGTFRQRSEVQAHQLSLKLTVTRHTSRDKQRSRAFKADRPDASVAAIRTIRHEVWPGGCCDLARI